jgi:mannose/fructose/N-acetylgalactosamine-specific phosphotransferase system component IIC
LEDSPVGFEKKTRNTHSVIVLVETGSTNAAAIDVFMNSLFSTELTVNAYTTTQRDALVGMPIGTVIYNTTTAVLNVWDGSVWDATV